MLHLYVFLLYVCFVSGQFNQNAELQKLVEEKEQIVLRIRDQVMNHYGNRCNNRDCDCSLSACRSKFPDGEMSCTKEFGSISGCGVGCDDNRMVNFKQSVVRTSTASVSTQMKHEECWTKPIDQAFINEKEQRSLSWQYFGTSSGLTRIYPGFAQEECGGYDPRLRPWYVAATSGPKDVVIIIDSSGSMSQLRRMDIAIEAVKTVLTTLTFADYVNVVSFSGSAFPLKGNHLWSATEENINELKNSVENLRPSGSTNFEAAFDEAFDLFENSDEYTSGCQKVILFMTDGDLTAGASGSLFYNQVSQRNQQNNAVIFTYSFGAQADDEYPKTLACQHSGTWSKIQDGGNLRDKMASFYEYFASLRVGQTQVVWSEPYQDAFGAGEMTTASIAVYDESTKPISLIGVIGVDILTEDLRKIEPDYQNLLNFLIFRSATCPILNFTECELEYIRETSFLVTETNTEALCNPSLTCTNITRPLDCSAGSYPNWCDSSSGQNYKEESCCSCLSAGAIAGIVIGCVVGVALIAVGTVFFVRYLKKRNAKRSSYKYEAELSYRPPPY